jgi:hypothetical protein
MATVATSPSFKPGSPERQVADLVEAPELVHDAQRPGLGAGMELPRAQAAARGLDARQHLSGVELVTLEPGEREVDAHLGRLHAVELDLGHARHAPQRVGDVAVQQLVVVRDVASRRDAAFEHRDVGGALAVDLDHVDVGRELVADAVELLARLDAQRPDVLAPVELHVDLGLVGGRRGVDVPHARQRGERLLGGPRDLFLDLGGQRVGVRNVDLEPGELDFGQERELQPRRGERPQHHDAQQHHPRRDRAAQTPAREVHGARASGPAWRTPPGSRSA